MTVTFIPGRTSGSRNVIHDGYHYCLDNKRDDQTYWRCTDKTWALDASIWWKTLLWRIRSLIFTLIAANSVYTPKQNMKRKAVFYWPPYKTPNRWRCWTPMRYPVAPRSLADLVLTLDYIRTNKCFVFLPTQRRGENISCLARWKTWIVWLRLLIFVGCTIWRLKFLSALEILCRIWVRVAVRNTVQVASILEAFALWYVSH